MALGAGDTDDHSTCVFAGTNWCNVAGELKPLVLSLKSLFFGFELIFRPSLSDYAKSKAILMSMPSGGLVRRSAAKPRHK